jgi:zinc and cadmium transporter
MNSELLPILGLAAVGSVAGLIGGIVFLFKKDWARVLCANAIPFAAGVLISTSVLHLIPESTHVLHEKGFVIVLVAFVASFLFEQFFASLHHHEDRKHTMLKATIPLVILGDTIHNFIDGVAIAAAYITTPTFGVIVALATFLHETPHEIGDFGVLMSAGWSRQKTFMANLFSALATFPGALFVYLFAQDAHDKVGVLLAVSAGIFLYLGASDFLPEVGEDAKKSRLKESVLFLMGVVIMYLLMLITPEH